MAQWVASANSLGHRYIDDPRADEEARIGQLLLANRAQRENEAARREAMAFQAQQAQERTRQFDEELARRQQSEDFQALQWLAGMDTAAAERQRAQENADRLFAASRQDASQRFDLERAQEERLREAGLFARRQADDPLARAAEQAKLDHLRAQIDALRRQPEQARLDDERQAAIRKDVAEIERQRAVAVAEAQAKAQGEVQKRLLQQSTDREDYLREKDDAKRRAEESKAAAEAQARRAAGLRDTIYNFQQALSDPKKFPVREAGGWITESDRAKAAADLLPVIEKAFLGGFDPNRADARPPWAPTSPEDEALLVEAIRRVLAERFPDMRRDFPMVWDRDAVPQSFFSEDPVAKVQSRWGASLFAPR